MLVVLCSLLGIQISEGGEAIANYNKSDLRFI